MRILRGLRSELLPCGCLAGVYETYSGDVVTLLDDRSPGCPESSHANGRAGMPLEVPSIAPHSFHASDHRRAGRSQD